MHLRFVRRTILLRCDIDDDLVDLVALLGRFLPRLGPSSFLDGPFFGVLAARALRSFRRIAAFPAAGR
jgi:hypothetical protein